MSKLFAQPYDLHATGFYFESEEEYDTKSNELVNEFGQPVEEFEIQFIDGDNPKLFEAAGINQSNIDVWFNEFDHISDDDDEARAIRFLMDHMGYDARTALDKADEVQVFEGTRTAYAEEFVGDAYELPEIAQRYFDYESFGRDLELGGDIVEIEHEVWCTNPHDL